MAGPSVGYTIREKRDATIHIAGRHGATEVRLIGSVARGEARHDSDRRSAGDVERGHQGWVKPAIRESVYRDAIAL